MELVTLDFHSLDPESLSGVTVRKHNDLIEARYKLPNLREQQVIYALLGKIKPEDEDFKGYQITVSDFAKFIGVNSKSIYEEMEQTLTNLAERTVKIKQGKSFLIASWLSSAKYVHGSGYVELRFDPNLKPYLLQLKDHFTQYKLDSILHFKSVYSIRLYEILKKEAFKAKIDPASKTKRFEVEYSYEAMREFFGVGKKEYSQFNNFKRKTIEPAVTEIYDKTELNILDVKYGKTGRAVSKITFVIEIRSKAEGDIRAVQIHIEDQPKEGNKKEELKQKMVDLGYGYEAARRDVNKYGIKRIERNIAYSLAKKQEGKVENFPAFLSQAITQDYGNNWEEAILDKKYRAEQKKEQEKLEEKRKEQQLAEEKKRSAKALKDFYAMPPEDRIELNEEFVNFLKHGTNHDLVLAVMFLDNTEKGEEVKDTLLKVKLATFLKSKGF